MLTMKESKLRPEVKAKIVEAIGFEYNAAFSYRHIKNHLQNDGWFGCAEFFGKESDDELKHAQAWTDFLNKRKDVLDCIPAINVTLPSISTINQAFAIYERMEIELGDFYNEWYESCDDASTMVQLIEFVNIQTNSIGEAADYNATLSKLMESPAALLQFDHEING